MIVMDNLYCIRFPVLTSYFVLFHVTNDLIQTPSTAQWCAAIISYNISNSVTAGLDLFTRLVKLLSAPPPGYKVSIFNVSHFSFPSEIIPTTPA